MLREKIRECVFTNLYLTHPQGGLLLDIDLSDLLDTQNDDSVELTQRILFLEQEVEDLRAENALMRTRICDQE